MEDKSNLEKVTGSLSVGVAGTAVAVLGTSITPLAAFVPFLLQSLATKRHSERLDKALNDINEILKSHGEEIKNINDYQYKLISEVVSAVFNTVDSEKIEFLKSVINNTVNNEELNKKNTEYLSRILRDISISEINFLIDNFKYEHIFFSAGKNTNTVLHIKPGSETEVIASGLINLGLIYSKNPTFDVTKYVFSPIVPRLIALLEQNA